MISLWLVLWLLVPPAPIDGSPVAVDQQLDTSAVAPMLVVGEELEYKVRYSFFTIGTIHFSVISKEMRQGRPIYRATVIIDSSPSLQWLLSVNIRFFGLMDSLIYSHTWLSEDSTADNVMFRSMVFDNPAMKMYYTKGDRSPSGVTIVTQNDTIATTGPSQDGLSLFFFAREHAQTRWNVEVPTFMDTSEAATKIRFTGERWPIEVSAVPYKVETVYLEGDADFVGVFGVTGGFQGWFSNDEARIPIYAKMKVLLGNVEVELTKWKRTGWSPPRYAK